MEFLRSFLRHQRALDLEDEDDYDCKIYIKVFSDILEKCSILHCTVFTWKVSAIIFIGDSLALSWSQNDWTCSCHYDILAKTLSRMTTTVTFSRQNDAGSRASTTQYWENLVLVVVLVSESKALYHFAGKLVVEMRNVGYFVRLANRCYY